MNYKLSVLLLSVFLCGHVTSDRSEDTLERWSIVYGVSSRLLQKHHQLNGSSHGSNQRDICYKHLEEIAVAIENRTRWGILVHDASGTPATGLHFGSFHWLGSRTQCLLYNTIKRPFLAPYLRTNYPDEKPPFLLAYFGIYAVHNSSIRQKVEWFGEDLITIGLCLPDSCSPSDLKPIIDDYFSSFTLGTQRIYGMNLEVDQIRRIEQTEKYKQSFMYTAFVSSCYLIAILAIVGTVYDNLYANKNQKSDAEINKKSVRFSEDTNGNVITDANGTNGIKEHNIDSNNASLSKLLDYTSMIGTEDLSEHESVSKPQVNKKLEDFLMCFSVSKNFDKLIDIKHGQDNILPINGWRVTSMMLVVFLHAVMYTTDRLNNSVTMHYQDLDNPDYFHRIFISCHFVVDSFLCLGGFLLARAFFKDNDINNMKQKPSRSSSAKEWLSGIWKRFHRLTAPYLFTIIMSSVIVSSLRSTSILRVCERVDKSCSKYWWTNILYINNIYPGVDGRCLSWSYYLSNDMQFYIIGSFLLYLAIYRPKTSVTLGMLLIAISTILIAYVAYTTEYYPYIHLFGKTMNTLYTPSWMRISPYLIGMGGAYFHHYHKDMMNNKTVKFLGWTVSILSAWFVLLGALHTPKMSLLYSTFYTAVSRQLWGLLSMWFFLTLITNNIWSPFYKFMSLDIWIPLSKLCYWVYLINPTIIYQVTLKSEKSFNVTDDDQLYTGLGTIVVTFIISFVMVLLIETPFNNLVNVLSTKKKQQDLTPSIKNTKNSITSDGKSLKKED